MWVIIVFNSSNSNSYTIFEYDTEREAREKFEKIQGCKYLSEVIYYQTPSPSLT